MSRRKRSLVLVLIVSLAAAIVAAGAIATREKGDGEALAAGRDYNVATFELTGGRTVTLTVKPLLSGGFCRTFIGLGGACDQERSVRMDPAMMIRQNADGKRAYVGGHLLADDAKLVVLEYEDGQNEQQRIVKVGEPVHAGFFLFEIPPDHLHKGHRPLEVRALNEKGEFVDRQRVVIVAETDHPLPN